MFVSVALVSGVYVLEIHDDGLIVCTPSMPVAEIDEIIFRGAVPSEESAGRNRFHQWSMSSQALWL